MPNLTIHGLLILLILALHLEANFTFAVEVLKTNRATSAELAAFVDPKTGDKIKYCQVWQHHRGRDYSHNLHDRHKKKHTEKKDKDSNSSRTDVIIYVGLLVIIIFPYTARVVKHALCPSTRRAEREMISHKKTKKKQAKQLQNKIIEIKFKKRLSTTAPPTKTDWKPFLQDLQGDGKNKQRRKTIQKREEAGASSPKAPGITKQLTRLNAIAPLVTATRSQNFDRGDTNYDKNNETNYEGHVQVVPKGHFGSCRSNFFIENEIGTKFINKPYAERCRLEI